LSTRFALLCYIIYVYKSQLSRVGEHVVNRGGCSVWWTSDGQTKLTALTCNGWHVMVKRQEIWLNSEFGTMFQGQVPLFLKKPEFPY